MRTPLKGLIFLTGWILSPFTWWNDAFVNIPLSYLIANILFYITHISFRWLVIGSYWFTNILGIFFMYAGGKGLMQGSKNRFKTIALLILSIIFYSAIITYLDKKGTLFPIGSFLARK